MEKRHRRGLVFRLPLHLTLLCVGPQRPPQSHDRASVSE